MIMMQIKQTKIIRFQITKKLYKIKKMKLKFKKQILMMLNKIFKKK